MLPKVRMTLALVVLGVLVILNLKDHPWQKSVSAVVPAAQATVVPVSVSSRTVVSTPASPASSAPQTLAVAANSAPAANPRAWQSAHDPFWPNVVPPSAIQSAPKPVAIVAAPPPATVVAQPVQQPYTVLGRLRGTDDADAIYLRKGNDLVQIERDMPLEGGFKVASIEAQQIQLVHVASGEKFLLALPVPDPN